MKKRLIVLLLALCLLGSLPPRVASAGTVFFTGVNSTLLPLQESTMPIGIGGSIYVPYKVFSYAGVYGTDSIDEKMLRIYRGSTRYVDFYVATGVTTSQDNHVYEDVTARILNGTFYVPLDFVCTFFSLRYHIIDSEPAPIIRIKSLDDTAILNDKSFVSIFSERMYSEYNAIVNPVTPQSPDVSQPPVTTQPPNYGDVTIYLSFHGISAGFADDVLSALSPGYRSCFFLSGEDILQNPGLVRSIVGSGHAIGIWLDEGTYEEYLDVSALLFEAAKAKSVLISSINAEAATSTARDNGLVFWPASRSYGGNATADYVITRLPETSGSRQNLLFSCEENIVSLLPGVLSALRLGGYTVSLITETVTPVK